MNQLTFSQLFFVIFYQYILKNDWFLYKNNMKIMLTPNVILQAFCHFYCIIWLLRRMLLNVGIDIAIFFVQANFAYYGK